MQKMHFLHSSKENFLLVLDMQSLITSLNFYWLEFILDTWMKGNVCMNSSIDGSKYKINYLFLCIDIPEACTDCGEKSHEDLKRGYYTHLQKFWMY